MSEQLEKLKKDVYEYLEKDLNKDQNNPYTETSYIEIDTKDRLGIDFLKENFYDIIDKKYGDRWDWYRESDDYHVKEAISDALRHFSNEIQELAETIDEDESWIEDDVKQYLEEQIEEDGLSYGYHDTEFKLKKDINLINENFIFVEKNKEELLDDDNNIYLSEFNSNLISALFTLKINPTVFLEEYTNQIKNAFLDANIIDEQGNYKINPKTQTLENTHLYYETWDEYLFLNLDGDDDYYIYFKNNNFNDAVRLIHEKFFAALDEDNIKTNIQLNFSNNEAVVDVRLFVEHLSADNDDTDFNLVIPVSAEEVEEISKNVERNSISLNKGKEHQLLRINGELQDRQTGKTIEVTNLKVTSDALYQDSEGVSTDYSGSLNKLYSDNIYNLISSINELDYQHQPKNDKDIQTSIKKINENIAKISNDELVPFTYLNKRLNSLDTKTNSNFTTTLDLARSNNKHEHKLDAFVNQKTKAKMAENIANLIQYSTDVEEDRIKDIINNFFKTPINTIYEHPIYYCSNYHDEKMFNGSKMSAFKPYLKELFHPDYLFVDVGDFRKDLFSICLENLSYLKEPMELIMNHPDFNPKHTNSSGENYLFFAPINIMMDLVKKGVEPIKTNNKGEIAVDKKYFSSPEAKAELLRELEEAYLEDKIAVKANKKNTLKI